MCELQKSRRYIKSMKTLKKSHLKMFSKYIFKKPRIYNIDFPASKI